MAIGTVKLTTTHASNTATLPANAQLDDGTNATVSVAGNTLYRSTGDGDSFPTLINITKVEAVCEVAGVLSGGGGTHALESRWGGVLQGSVAFTTTGVKRLDVTASRTWVKADFSSASLQAVTKMTGGAGTDGHNIDYLWYEVTYDELVVKVVNEEERIDNSAKYFYLKQFVNETVNIVENRNSILHIIVNEVERSVESFVGMLHVRLTETVSSVESMASRTKLVINETINIVEASNIFISIRLIINETVRTVETSVIIIYIKIILNETINLVESRLALPKLIITVQETVSIVYGFVRARMSFVPLRRADASTFTGRESETLRTQRQGMQPWPVKVVPKEQAAHIDRKTVTHMHQMFRNLYDRLKGTSASDDTLKKEE